MLETLFHRQVANFWMKWPHVIAVRQSKVFVKAILLREKLVMMSQMPLAESSRCIALLLQEFRKKCFSRIQTGIPIALGQQAEDPGVADDAPGHGHAVVFFVVDTRIGFRTALDDAHGGNPGYRVNPAYRTGSFSGRRSTLSTTR
mgnify:CR=1 FL=1